MKQLKHWQDPANGVLGVWLALSPWIVQYASHTTAMTNAVIAGVLLIAAALGAMLVPRAWEEWTEAALGVWMVISPWVLGFSTETNAMNTAVGTGIVVAALAAWTLATDRDYNHWLHPNA